MPPLLKSFLKRCFQIAAANLGKHRFSLVEEPELLILMYHRILPEGDERLRYEEPGMSVTPESFEVHLQTLKKEFDVMALDDWIERKQTGQKLPRKACAITFDDGWADNYEYAFPLLKKHRFPATIFLVSEYIGTDARFWPERLARLVVAVAEQCPEQQAHQSLAWLPFAETGIELSAAVPNREQLSQLIVASKSMSDEQIHQNIDKALQALELDISSDKASILSWEQLAEMDASGLVEYGSHTCTHARLNDSMDALEIKRQISESKRLLKERLGQKVELFCFPNGDYTNDTLEVVIRHYNAAVTTSTGWNVKSSDSYRLRRVGVHQDIAYDRIAFLGRISDWM